MLYKLSAAFMLVPTLAFAGDISCKGASEFYQYAGLMADLVQAVAGSCADDVSQPACIVLMDALKDSDVKKLQGADAEVYLRQVKDRCPDYFPEDQGYP